MSFTLFLPEHFGADKAREHFTTAMGVSAIEAQDGDPLLSLVGDRRVMALNFAQPDFSGAIAFFAEHPYLAGCLTFNGDHILLQHLAGGQVVLDAGWRAFAQEDGDQERIEAACEVATLPQAFL